MRYVGFEDQRQLESEPRQLAAVNLIVAAWTIPETGVRAPDLMLVAVRAIAPVAGIPPTNGTARLATP